MTTSDGTAPPYVAPMPRRRGTLSIKSLILLMLLAVSIGSVLVVGVIGYVGGSDALRDAAYARLIDVRDARAGELTSMLDATRQTLVVAANDRAVADALAGGDAWDAAAAAELLGVDELALLDGRGLVVAAVGPTLPVGESLASGRSRFTGLADTFRGVALGIDESAISDFETLPDQATPASWVVAAVPGGAHPAGVLAMRLPAERIDTVMTDGGDWTAGGLGRTGETYVVGRDGLMRSQSRDLAEDPQAYRAAAIKAGLTVDKADAAVASGSTLLAQRVDTDAVREALGGRTGTVVASGYLGGETIAAYAPVSAGGLDWIVVAEIDSAEALAPVADFTLTLAVSTVLIVVVVSIVSVLIAGAAVRPLRRLRDAARRIAAGENGVQVEAGESDELADVASAFNDMSSSLETRSRLIDDQRSEIDRLLHTLMPDTLAKRYRDGARTIVEDHQDVTVLFADIVGFEEFGRELPSDRALDLLNDIFRALDDAAEQLGVERVRTTRQGYLASCGLSVPRVDHVRRAVDFAFEAERIVARFGAQQGATLAVRVGIDTGTVTSGLVGRSRVVHDLWGDAVSLAFRLQRESETAGVLVTQRVLDDYPAELGATAAGELATASGTQKVWRVEPQVVSA